MFKCEWCDFATHHKQSLERHVSRKKKCRMIIETRGTEDPTPDTIEQNTKRFTCRHCDKRFTTKNSMYRHIRKLHKPSLQDNLLLDFGKETVHFEPDFLTECLLMLSDGIVRLTRVIHFDIPHHKNVRVKSRKQNLFAVREDGKWIVSDKNNTLDRIIRKCYAILYGHFVSARNFQPDIQRCDEVIYTWLASIGRASGLVYFKLRRDLASLVINQA